MKFYILPCFLILTTVVLGQNNTISDFEKAKGTLDFPISNCLKVTKSFFDSSLNFETKDTCALHSIYNGTVVKVTHIKDDESVVIIIIRSDSFYITYAGILIPKIKQGESVKTNQKIAALSKDEFNEYEFKLYISTSATELNPALWFKDRNVIKQLSASLGVY
jgi:hypothetical protein